MKKIFAKAVAVALTVVMAFGLAGCSEQKIAKKNLSKCLDLLKSGEYYEAISNYVYNQENSNDFLGCGDEFNENSFPAYKLHKAIFDSMDYKITNTKTVNESEIHFTVEISHLDCQKIGEELATMTAGYNIASFNAEDEEKLSDGELNDLMTKQLQSISNDYIDGGKLKKATDKVEVTMGYSTDGKWYVIMSDKLYHALTGNVYKAYYEAIQNAELVTKK